MSIIKCIGINKYTIPAFVIFQGQRIQHEWISPDLHKDTAIHISPNGLTTQEIAVEWLKHFDTYTKPQIRGTYRILVLDGHNSHVSLDFVQYCESNQIIPLCLPPHSTHILQPLDVGRVFATCESIQTTDTTTLRIRC